MKIYEILVESSVPEVILEPADKNFRPPVRTITAFKLFRVDKNKPGKLFPLFVKADKPVELGVWYEAEVGDAVGKKVKSKLGPLAFRPGWHAGDSPIATHIGDLSPKQKAEKSRIDNQRKKELEKLLNTDEIKNLIDNGVDKKIIVRDLKKRVKEVLPYPKGISKPSLRPSNQVWAEVEISADVDWQDEATRRGTDKSGKFKAAHAHITDQIPHGGHYRYKTNPNMIGNWIIGGAMKVNRVLDDQEVQALNKQFGVKDLPRDTEIDLTSHGF